MNNITQMLHAIGECQANRLSLEELRQTFDAFAETWEGFQARWKLDKLSVPKVFSLSPSLEGIYKKPLLEIEEAFTHLDDAFAQIDELETVDTAALDRLADNVRSFFTGVCSATALIFKKLENPKGDFGALLSNFGL